MISCRDRHCFSNTVIGWSFRVCLGAEELEQWYADRRDFLYNYKCDLCHAEYVGYTSRHLHQGIDEHRYSAIGKHLKNDHSLETIGDLTKKFSVLKKCNGKLDCLIHEMLFIKKKRPRLNTQSDSIRAKLFI